MPALLPRYGYRRATLMNLRWSLMLVLGLCVGCTQNEQNCWPSSRPHYKRPSETRDGTRLRIRLKGCVESENNIAFPGAMRVTIENVSPDSLWVSCDLYGSWVEITKDPPDGHVIAECPSLDVDWRKSPPNYMFLGQRSAVSLRIGFGCKDFLPREGRFRVVMHYHDARTDGPTENYSADNLWFTGEVTSNPIVVVAPPPAVNDDCGP